MTGAGYLFGNRFDTDATKKGGQYFLIGRVESIVLGEFLGNTNLPDPNYRTPADIGSIRFQLLYSPLGKRRTKAVSDSGNKPAYPFFSFNRQYPLLGETVLIMTGPSPGLNDDYNSQRLYYFPPYFLWNDSNHNAFPDLDELSAYRNQFANKPGYSGTAATGSGFPLGYSFKEKYVRNLKPYEGDSILQARFGQSIRFGSTNGDPITIINNEQGTRTELGKFDSFKEDMNRDGSSIYMTSNQKVDLKHITDRFYPKKQIFSNTNKYQPQFPFLGKHLILSSDRIVLHSKTDSIFLFGEKAVAISSLNTVNLDAKEKITMRSPKIELGFEAVEAGDPLILGKKFITQFSRLLDSLNESAKLMKDIASNGTPVANPNIVTSFQKIRDAAGILEQSTAAIKLVMDSGNILSENTYTR
jgi:hypothetical protein